MCGLLLLLGPQQLKALETRRDYELAAGPAGPALNQLAAQNNLQLIFPTEFELVPVRAVQGRHTVREALAIMLHETPLSARLDAETGIVAVAQAAGWADRLVQLPPYVVDSGPESWRYARMGSIEILSACADEVTQRVLEQLFRLQEALDLIVPPDLRFQSQEPVRYVLHSDRTHAAVPKELMDRLRRFEEVRTTTPAGTTAKAWNLGTLRNYGFWEQDARSFYFILNDAGFMQSRLTFRADHVRDLLTRRTPALPDWFVAGVLEFYRSASLDPYGATSYSMENRNRHRIPGGIVSVTPAEWINERETGTARRGADMGLLPLRRILNEPPPLPGSALRAQWQAQAGLLVRWALENGPAHRTALWRLAAADAAGQRIEGRFGDFFGFSMEQADEKLRVYLRRAVSRGFDLRPKKFAEMPAYLTRPASDLDKAVVKGEVDRLKIGYVRRHFPVLTDRYVEQARNILQPVLQTGMEDVRLFELAGLCECDAGDDAAALPWLEQAVAAGSARPRVYYELARIRWQRLEQPSASASIVPADQVKALWALLGEACRQAPPLVKVYELMVELADKAPVTPKQEALLTDGLQWYPRHVGLIEAVVRLQLRAGHIAEARSVLQQGLGAVLDGGGQVRLRRLQAELAAYGS